MTQSDAAAKELLELEDVAWPITFRWEVESWWGRTRQEATINAPLLDGALEPSWKLGEELWRRAVAPATSSSAELVGYDTIIWRLAPQPIPTGVAFAPGMLGGTTSSRDEQGCLVLHTGHSDRRARRRFHLPAIPSSWHSGGLLDPGGLRALDSAAKLLWMGFNGGLFGGPFRWLIVYPDELPPTITNPRGVGFRTVEYVRSCWHTAKAPTLSSEPYP
jgi:hypothetical protein